MSIQRTRLGKLIQQITKWDSQRETEAWTDGRQAADDKYVELDNELAVALVECDGMRSKVHSSEGHSSEAKSRVRGLASAG